VCVGVAGVPQCHAGACVIACTGMFRMYRYMIFAYHFLMTMFR
jgi:hypothetical protein